VDKILNNNPEGFLQALFADPSADKTLYTTNLAPLVSEYPQSGVLRALIASGNGSDENLKHAAVYFNARLLYKMVNNPTGLINVTPEKIIKKWAGAADSRGAENFVPFFVPDGIPENPPKEVDDDTALVATEQTWFQPVPDNEGAILHATADETEKSTTETSPAPFESGDLKAGSFLEKELFIFGKSLNELKENIESLNNSRLKSPAKQDKSKDTIVKADKNLTKYHDDTMPYTFLWWLNKTRKEHAGVYQPYAKHSTGFTYEPNREKINIDELQHQYFENIFHITTVVDLEKSTAGKTAGVDANRKENQLIERFIKEDPQIKPQQSDKLDNENKAKRSSEDQDEIVTETLAAIYAEQMLYHKAISAYKKLMLKFPEKSVSFAVKIEQLEKKINL
jgi:hypothetical protein